MGIPWVLVCRLEMGGNLSWQAADSYCVFVLVALIRQVHPRLPRDSKYRRFLVYTTG